MPSNIKIQPHSSLSQTQDYLETQDINDTPTTGERKLIAVFFDTGSSNYVIVHKKDVEP